MRNLIVLIAVALCIVSCSSPSGRRVRAERETKDSVQYSYSTDAVKCINVEIAAYVGDSVVYWREVAFVKNSSKADKFIKIETDAIMRYNSSVDSVRVNKHEFEVRR